MRRLPRARQSRSSAASDVDKTQESDRDAVDQNEAVIVGTESNEEAIRCAESDSKTCSTYLYDNDPL